MTNPHDDRSTTDDSAADHPRRRVLLGAGTALSVAIAGCSGDGDSDSDSNGDDAGGDTATPDSATGTPTSTPEGPTKEPAGSVGTNAIDELDLVGWQSEPGEFDWRVEITVENTGSEATNLELYTWGIRLYDESDEELSGGVTPTPVADDDEVPAGETGTLSLEQRPDEPSAVASYELFLTCEGTGAYSEGVYCPDE